MKLYYSPGACSLASHIILAECAAAAGFTFETQLVSAADGSAQKPEHLARNPKGQVPVLENGDFTLTENQAILVFLAREYPQANVLPAGNVALARAMEWINWLTASVHAQHVGQVWRSVRFSDDTAAHPSIIAKGKQHVEKSFATIEAKLTGKTWALNETFSIVDAFIVVFYRWGNRMGYDMNALYPNWAAHTARMLARPAVQQAFATEGIVITG